MEEDENTLKYGWLTSLIEGDVSYEYTAAEEVYNKINTMYLCSQYMYTIDNNRKSMDG